MIVDSSALISVIFNEADEDRFVTAMIDAPLVRMSAANWLEAAIVVDARRDPNVEVRFDEVIRTLGIQIAPVTEGIALHARRAYVQFGRGNHPARLNYGDCFAMRSRRSNVSRFSSRAMISRRPTSSRH
jgi:ribonuclease VapC